MTTPRILVLSLGGTITMLPVGDAGGIAPKLGGAELVAVVPALARQPGRGRAADRGGLRPLGQPWPAFVANAVRLRLHALAYNLGTFLRALALRGGVERWSLTTRREKLVKTGANVVSHGGCGSTAGSGRRRRLNDCTGPNECILSLTAPGIRGMSAYQ